MRLPSKILKGEGGQTLPIVLILLLVGALLVMAGLAFMFTNLKANQVVDQATRGLYAADSGVEDALQRLRYTEGGPPLSYSLSEDVNSMSVAIVTNEKGTYTLYAGELVTLSPSGCWERLDIGSQIVGYEYTVTIDIAEQPPGPCGGHIKLIELGVMLPVGYSYVAGSAEGELSTDDPGESLEGSGAWKLTWTWERDGLQITGDGPNAAVTRYQRFDITGTGDLGGYYAWVVAKRKNIGTVGELSGTLYTITATATQGGENTAKVMAEVMRIGSATPYDIEVVSWQITK